MPKQTTKTTKAELLRKITQLEDDVLEYSQAVIKLEEELQFLTRLIQESYNPRNKRWVNPGYVSKVDNKPASPLVQVIVNEVKNA